MFFDNVDKKDISIAIQDGVDEGVNRLVDENVEPSLKCDIKNGDNQEIEAFISRLGTDSLNEDDKGMIEEYKAI